MIKRILSKIKKQNLFPYLFLLTANIAVLYFFRESLITSFFQDDWYSLTISKVARYSDLVNFFRPDKQVVYYRPLGMQLPFFINTLLFNINPLPFRILTFITHGINSFLVFLLFKRLLKSYFSSLMAAFLYVTSGINYIPFFWSSTFAFILGMTFSLLTIIYFLDFLDKQQLIKFYLSLMFFFLGLLTFEVITVLPVILAVYVCLFKFRQKFSFLFPFFFISFFYLAFRFIFFPPPDIPDYHVSLGRQTLQNFKYYFLWSFNWPEEIKNQFIKFWQVNPKFIREFRNFYDAFRLSLVVNLFLLFVLPVILAVFKKIKINFPVNIFAIIWFVSGLLPVIFFPRHTFPYYLPLSFIGLLLFFLPLLQQSVIYLSRKFNLIQFIIQLVLMINWLWSVSMLTEFNSLIHWAPRRGRLSAKLIKTAKYRVTFPYQSFVFLANPDSETRLSLNDQDALRIIFQRDDLKTIYTSKNFVGYRL